MRSGIVLGSLLALWALPQASADDPKGQHAHHPAPKHPGLEKFKLLTGEWVGKGTFAGEDLREVRVIYKLTAGGNTVEETEFPGTDHEMVTLIHADGDALILTHYCHLNNQPRMKATGKWDGNTVSFKFLDATNLKSPNDPHMHDATYTFVDRDTLKAEWTFYRDGKPAGTASCEYRRKK